MAAASLWIDQLIDIREEDGRVVIEPIKAPAYDLDDLLDVMTPDSVPEEVDFGPAVGRGKGEGRSFAGLKAHRFGSPKRKAPASPQRSRGFVSPTSPPGQGFPASSG
jgi:antitoxin MazE